MENFNTDSFSNSQDLDASAIPQIADLALVTGAQDPLKVKENFTGTYPNNKPAKVPIDPPAKFDVNAHMKAMNDWNDASVRNTEDKNEWGKMYSYNPGPTGSFYKRYSDAGFNIPGAREFHPLRDNETSLNNNTNFMGDLWRTTTQAMLPMIWNGVKSTYSSMARIVNQNDWLGEDPKLAREYAYITAKNYSSKDNLGSFANNLTMNLGYTVGIMSTAMAENWIGAGVSAFQGARAGLTAAKSGNMLFKEYQAGKAAYNMKSYSELLSEFKDINKVRQEFDRINGISKFQKAITSPVGRVLNPISNLTENLYAIKNSTDGFNGFFKTAGSLGRTAGAAYKDFRNINLAVSEARLESGMVYNNIFDDLYQKSWANSGKAPSDKELENIIKTAKKAAYETSAMNAGLIYMTNKISWDNILNPRVGAQGFLRQRIVDWKTVGGGRFGEIGNVAFDVAKNEWKFAEKGFKNWWNRWKTDPFHKSVWGTVGYFKRNLFEGFQESLQETIAFANEKYYKDTFNTPTARKHLINKAVFGKGTTPMSYYGEGLNEQFSREGFSVFASGIAMGSFAGGLNKSMSFLYEKANQIFDPVKYQEYKTEKSKIVDDLVIQMNLLGVDEMINSRLFNGGVQDILSKVHDAGGKKEVRDAESEALISHFTMLKEYGVLDIYLDAIESYKDFTNAEFKEAFPKIEAEDAPKYKQRISETVDKARAISKSLDNYDKLYPNPIDLTNYSKDDPDYENAYIMHHTWEYGKKSAVFYNEVYSDVRDRMIAIMQKSYEERPLQGMTKRQSDIILRPEDMQNEIGLLKNEANNLIAVGDVESKKAAKEKLKLVEAYEGYVEAYESFTDYYHRDRYFNRAKTILQEEKNNEDVTDDEVNQYLEDRFGPKNQEIEEEILLNLESQYNNLLRNISSKPDDFLFTTKVDDSFELVLDFYKLNDESREMVDLINLMNDPNGFLDVYARNEKWMTDLWLKKSEYYRDIAKQELSDIEANGLLNYLANKGIFMETNSFIQWRDEGIPPKEFYDERKNLVIPEGSLAHSRYMLELDKYQELADEANSISERFKNVDLELRINELLQRRDSQLDKLEVQFNENLIATTGEDKEAWLKKQSEKPTGRTQDEINKELDGLKATLEIIEKATTIQEIYDLYNSFAEQGLIPENYSELIEETMLKNKEKAKAFFKSTKDSGSDLETRQKATQHKITLPQILNDKIAIISNEKASEGESNVPPIETTDAWKDYQKQVDSTMTRYDALIQKLKDQIKSEAEPIVTPKETSKKDSNIKVDPNASWNDLPNDLRIELETAFNLFLTSPTPEGLNKPKNFNILNPDQYNLIRNNWLEQQKDLINEYNSRNLNEESVLPTIKYLTLDRPIIEYSITDIRTLSEGLQKIYDVNAVGSKKLSAADRVLVKNDIDQLNKYLGYLRSNYVPKNRKQAIFRIFEEMVLNKQNGVERILDAEGFTTGYTFPGKDGSPMRVTKLTETIDNTENKAESYLYDAIKEPYVDNKGNKAGGQLLTPFRDFKNDLDIKSDEERLELFMSMLETSVNDGKLKQLNNTNKISKIRKALTNNFTEEALIAVVKDVANSESTIAGNVLDSMIRQSFKLNNDGGFVKPTKPSKMSQDAYDNLFGQTGIITKLQDSVIDGKYEILSEDVIIYDSTLLESGLVGAMDLIAIDKDGNLMIIDIKTGKLDNWNNFNDDNKFNKKYNYRIQQSIYRTLLFNMTGVLAKTINILPIAITVNLDGDILSAESAAKNVNLPAIRELKTKKLALENASNPDVSKITEIQNKIDLLEKSITVPLEPISEDVLKKYGVIMKAPAIPDNLNPEKVLEKNDSELENKKKSIAKINKRITDINNRLDKIKNKGLISVGNTVSTSPEYTKLIKEKTKLEKELSKLTDVKDNVNDKKINDLKSQIEKLKLEKSKLKTKSTTDTKADIKTKEAEIKELERQKSDLTNVQPTQTTSGKTYQDLFNEKWSDASGYLTMALEKGVFKVEESKFVEGKHIYEIRPIGNGQFEYRVVSNQASQYRSYNNVDKFIKLASQELNAPDNTDTIVTVKPGILKRESNKYGDGFVVVKEAEVFYANSNTINNKVGTTTAAPTKVDTTEIDNKIAKANAELAALEGTTELTNEELNAGPTAGNQTFNKPVSTKEEIKVYVAGPVLKASEIFWDKNIRTTGSWVPSIQDVGGKSGPNNYIEIEYDSLSEENKKIALELTEEGSFRTFDKSNNVRIVIPGNNLSIEEIQRKSIEIANKFKNQDLLWYTPQTLDEAVTVLEEWKKQRPQEEKEYNDEIERVKNTWGQDLYSNQYFDKATNAIWASKELYDKSKGSPVKTTTTDTKAIETIDAKISKLELEILELEKSLLDSSNKTSTKININSLLPINSEDLSTELKSFIDKINNAKDLDTLQSVYDDAVLELLMTDSTQNNTDIQKTLDSALSVRKKELSEGLSEESIVKGQYLISKNPIFGNVENQIVQVTKNVDGVITIKQIENIENGKPKTQKLTTAQIKIDFTKTTEEALKQEEVMEPTPEEKENSKISKSSLKEFRDNPDLIDKAKQNAQGTTKKDRLAALKNKSKEDNINKCKPT